MDKGKTNLLVKSFLDEIERKIPNIFDTDGLFVTEHGNHIEMALRLKIQKMIDDMTDFLEKNLEVKIIHADCSYDEKEFYVVGISKPVEDNMFMIYISSSMYGITNNLYIELFDSIEVMLNHVVEVYNLTESRNETRKILERINEKSILSIFNL